MMRNTTPPPGRIDSVHRALALLQRILDDGSVSVTEAAAQLDVNRSTAQRLLATLAGDGFAAQSSDRRYTLGPALDHPRLAHPAPPAADALRPALEALFARTGETVHISVLHGTMIQQVDGIEATEHALRFGLHTGRFLPAHLSAAGRAMLAALPDNDLAARYALAGSDVDLAALRETMREVRATRVATNLDDTEAGIAALAISIGSVGGQYAALSIAAPSARYSPELGEAWRRDLIAVADGLQPRRS